MAGIFENNYKAAAKTELERSLRELEKKDKAAQTWNEFHDSAVGMQSNIAFSQRLGFISKELAEDMKRRLEAAVKFEQTMRNESQERVDDFENPRERAARYFDRDNINAEISRERAQAEAARASESEKAQKTHSAPSEDDRAIG